MKKSLLSLVAAAAISGAAGGQAQAEEIVVHKGDTLWGLSKKYDVSVESIKKWNKLSSDVIYPNDLLEVSPIKYVQVREGDTLWNIAKSYGVSVDELKSWNKLSSDLIRPGLRLAIYTDMPAEVKAKVANSTPATTTVSAPAPAKAANTAKPSNTAKPAASSNEMVVEATAYTASCVGCSGITKTGVNLNANPNAKVIAVDPSIIPLGTKVFVEGYGYATAEDIGGAIKGNRIDVFIPTKDAALAWGRKQVKVTIID